ncbi:MAG TPA: class F sortase [Candidatus Saccharimonadales bacterium]|jgi:LPXTG-site transpeptidase (sortase) family protein|nr:class F sortase [Candidatus Saccharimonadales bacterium]
MPGWFGKKARFYGLAGLLNLAVGVMFYTVGIAPISVSANIAPATQRIIPQALHITQGIPIRVVVPSASIDLPVKVGSYNPDSASWDVDMDNAYYADVSVPVNNSNGTTMIYGHAQSDIFENLPSIQPDTKAVVYTDNGYEFHYQHTTSRLVLPTDVSVFTESGPPELVLQTCIGVYSELRGLYSFKLVAINKI